MTDPFADLRLQRPSGFHYPRRLFFYAENGMGKSSWAAKAEKAKFIDIDDGLGDIDCDPFPLAKTVADVWRRLEFLKTQDHDYKAVVVDTMDAFERIIWAEIEHNAGRNIKEIGGGFGKGEDKAIPVWRRLKDELDHLNKTRKMTVILLAHRDTDRVSPPDGDPYEMIVPSIHKKPRRMFTDWCDEVFYGFEKVVGRVVDAGFGVEKNQAVGTGQHMIRTAKGPAILAKCRLDLPEEMSMGTAAEPNFKEYQAAWPQNTKGKESNG